MAATVLDQAVIEKLAAIVRVPRPQRHRQAPPDVVDAGADAPGPDAPHGFQFDPAARDVDADEAAQIEALG